jgi:hypothetical protein
VLVRTIAGTRSEDALSSLLLCKRTPGDGDIDDVTRRKARPRDFEGWAHPVAQANIHLEGILAPLLFPTKRRIALSHPVLSHEPNAA